MRQLCRPGGTEKRTEKRDDYFFWHAVTATIMQFLACARRITDLIRELAQMGKNASSRVERSLHKRPPPPTPYQSFPASERSNMPRGMQRLFLFVSSAVVLGAASSSAITQEERQFEAFDCSAPGDVQIVQDEAKRPCSQKAKALTQKNITYLVLQKADLTRITIRECKVVRTVTPFYCGVYDHSTPATAYTKYRHPVPVSEEECERLHRTHVWIDVNNKKHKLFRGKTGYIHEASIGSTSSRSGHTSCKGGHLVLTDGTRYKGFVVPTYFEVDLKEVEATISEDGVTTLHVEQKILPCKFHKHACITDKATYLWEALTEMQQCRYYGIRTMAGIDVMGEDETGEKRTTFLSTDGAMTRLTHKATVSECGQVVTTTTSDNLYLTQEFRNPAFRRPLHPSEMSVVTYANSQDEFLYGELTEYIQAEFARVVENDCIVANKKVSKYGHKAAALRAAVDGETFPLGKGTFATAAGESWYTYRCKPIIVSGRSDKHCFGGLPVDLSPEDETNYRNTHGDDNAANASSGEPRFFIEPRSHRLTRLPVVEDCNELFSPLYRNYKGNWIRAGPALTAAKEPIFLHIDEYIAGLPKQFDFSSGGIYTAEAVRAMEKYNQAPRAERANLRTFTRQSWGSPRDSNGYFIGGLGSVANPLTKFTNMIMGHIRNWGMFCAGVIGVGTAIKITTWIIGIVLRLCTAPISGSPITHIFSAIMPSLGPYMTNRNPTTAFLARMRARAFHKHRKARKDYDVEAGEGHVRFNMANEESINEPMCTVETGRDLYLNQAEKELTYQNNLIATLHKDDTCTYGNVKVQLEEARIRQRKLQKEIEELSKDKNEKPTAPQPPKN